MREADDSCLVRLSVDLVFFVMKSSGMGKSPQMLTRQARFLDENHLKTAKKNNSENLNPAENLRRNLSLTLLSIRTKHHLYQIRWVLRILNQTPHRSKHWRTCVPTTFSIQSCATRIKHSSNRLLRTCSLNAVCSEGKSPLRMLSGVLDTAVLVVIL